MKTEIIENFRSTPTIHSLFQLIKHQFRQNCFCLIRINKQFTLINVLLWEIAGWLITSTEARCRMARWRDNLTRDESCHPQVTKIVRSGYGLIKKHKKREWDYAGWSQFCDEWTWENSFRYCSCSNIFYREACTFCARMKEEIMFFCDKWLVDVFSASHANKAPE